MTPPKAPQGLSEASREAWKGLAADVLAFEDAAAVDLDLLDLVLRAADRLAAVRLVLDASGVTVAGSMGQIRPHPLLATESLLRSEIAQGYARLRLAPRERQGAGIYAGRNGRLRG
jgi:hypothetical protein